VNHTDSAVHGVLLSSYLDANWSYAVSQVPASLIRGLFGVSN